MAKTKETRVALKRFTWVIWGVLAALVVVLVSAFSKAWQTNQALRAEMAALGPMATAAMDQQLALEQQLAYVKSDEYVESWAQVHARMARPGEVLVIPIETTPTPAPTPQLPMVPTAEPTPVPFFPSLWQSLTGN
jgi:cell division protein FtsB